MKSRMMCRRIKYARKNSLVCGVALSSLVSTILQRWFKKKRGQRRGEERGRVARGGERESGEGRREGDRKRERGERERRGTNIEE